jgi:hypothetical protein
VNAINEITLNCSDIIAEKEHASYECHNRKEFKTKNKNERINKIMWFFPCLCCVEAVGNEREAKKLCAISGIYVARIR